MATTTVSTRRAHTQDKLLDAAIAVFAEKGVLGASVEEICERAGFTRGAFYSNFDSKDELCVAVLRRKGEEVLRAARRATDSVPGERIEPRSVDEVIRHAVSVFQAGHPIDREWLLARNEMRLYALRNPSIREPLLSVEQSLDELLIAAIGGVVERQAARLTIPLGQLTTLLNAYYEAISIEALMEDRDPDSPEWAEQLAAMVRALVVFPDRDT